MSWIFQSRAMQRSLAASSRRRLGARPCFGTTNDSGTSSTVLTSVSDSPTLSVRNIGTESISQAINCFSNEADGLASSAGQIGGNGLLGVALNPAKSGVRGEHANGTAVSGRGTGASGRGGVFQGQAAAVQLVGSSRATHPSSGRRGDLVVDASGRLWFCKGGTTWRQLA